MLNYGYNYTPYNPMLNTQQRLNQLEQQYPQYAQNSSPSLATIPVTNIAEANAYRVDVNGTPTFFYNAGTNEVYMKRTNLQTGLADFIVFTKAEQPITEVKPQKGTNTYEENFKALNDKIDGLYSLLKPAEITEEISETKKAGKNAK